MDTCTSEQALRREAIRRRVQGEPRRDICRDLERATSWLDKWWAEYRRNPHTDFADRARTPHTSPQRMPSHVEHAIVSVRQTLEAALTPDTRYGLIGARAIRGQLEQLEVTPLPSPATIQRILRRHHLTHPLGAAHDSAYYPWLTAWEVNAIHATDIITRWVRGGEVIQNFHTIDHYSQAVHLTQQPDKTSATTCSHLLETWADLGVPLLQQFDNEGAFCGGHAHGRGLGQVVRLCLFCGVEPLFTPFYEPKRNYQVETFHSLWVQAFWSRTEFDHGAHVRAEVPQFVRWYHTVYQPPALQGRTPAQMRQGLALVRLTREGRGLIPDGRLPLSAGRLHFLRKVDASGQVRLLNETWSVGRRWMGEYVRATLHTGTQKLTFWHQADAQSDWRLIKTRSFRVKESVHDLLPAFRRNRTRCRDYLPA